MDIVGPSILVERCQFRKMVIFKCPECGSILEQYGTINKFVCIKCKKLFEVKIHIEYNEIASINDRKMIEDGHSKTSVE